jgi:hypothetical protein
MAGVRWFRASRANTISRTSLIADNTPVLLDVRPPSIARVRSALRGRRKPECRTFFIYTSSRLLYRKRSSAPSSVGDGREKAIVFEYFI